MTGSTDASGQVLIAGGGIGGLAAALALAQTGRGSHALEQSTRFGEIGAGILADRVAAAKGDFEAAFQAYDQARYLRTGCVQLTARYYGEAYHAAGVTAEVRNMMLGNRRPEQAFEGLGWLYDGI